MLLQFYSKDALEPYVWRMTTLLHDEPTDVADENLEQPKQVKVTLAGRLIAKIYALRDHYDLTSVAATVRVAVNVFEELTDVEKQGGTVVYRRPDGTEQILKIIVS